MLPPCADSFAPPPRLGVHPGRAARARHRPADQLRGVVLCHRPALVHSEGLAWWNFAFLFTITLIPFTSGLLGLYAENPLAVDIFAANILLASLASLATARFIKRKGLASAAYYQEHARAGQIRAFSVATIMAVSMAVAWQNPDIAKYLWILIAFLPDIVIRATRRRSGRPPAAPGPVTG
jgi:hypothetical protein